MFESGPTIESRWSPRLGVGTAAILLVIVVLFAIESFFGALDSDPLLLRLGALPNNGDLHGQYWRLLSFGLLHKNTLHFIENSFCLLCLGLVVEKRIGPGRLLALFLIASVASGLAILLKYHFIPPSGASVGASGGMFGILGAALVLIRRVPPTKSLVQIGVWLILAGGIAVSFLPPGSLAGHVAGLIVGVPFGIFTQTQTVS
jgi:rhomboid protease GluP